MKNLFVLFALFLGLASCSSEKQFEEDFYLNYLHYLDGRADMESVVNVYVAQFKNLELQKMHSLTGTQINLLCSFYEELKEPKLSSSKIKPATFDRHFAIMNDFLNQTNNAGNIYRDCARVFNLPINKNWRINGVRV